MQEYIHTHNFYTGNDEAQKGTLYATILTATMMIVEIVAGSVYHSMALFADGWHMSTHALALGLAFFAYVLAKRYANDSRFNFGTYKIEVLGGFTSAILLLLVALFMAFESVQRFLNPIAIAYKEAIFVACIGLIVNLLCAYLLKDKHHHHHTHEHHHHTHHHEHDQDLNLKAAYIHVIADALTSILAIIALFGGMLFGASFLDQLLGIVGSILIFVWAINLIKQTGRILLDATMDRHIIECITKTLDTISPSIKLDDLHIFSVGKGKYACIIALSHAKEIPAAFIKNKLATYDELVHISIEIDK